MKVFVTGHKGYIGTHVVDLLKQEGHTVTGCDLNIFKGCEWESYPSPDYEIIKDIRNIDINDLDGHECVIHLAAISNDPMGEINPALTYSINRDGSIYLAKLAKKVGVERYLFSSSCSVYGKNDSFDVKEGDFVKPLSVYAKSKIEAESAITKFEDQTFTPVFLRNATAYGHSPMLRIDLVVNNLLSCGVVFGEIQIMSDGSPWRPLIHCSDIARAFVACMKAPKKVIHNRVINIGANEENHQVKRIAAQIRKNMPSSKIRYMGETNNDPRSYKVNFDLLYELLPDFKLEYDLVTGIEQLYQKLIEHNFGLDDFLGDKFVRLRILRKRIRDCFGTIDIRSHGTPINNRFGSEVNLRQLSLAV